MRSKDIVPGELYFIGFAIGHGNDPAYAQSYIAQAIKPWGSYHWQFFVLTTSSGESCRRRYIVFPLQRVSERVTVSLEKLVGRELPSHWRTLPPSVWH